MTTKDTITRRQLIEEPLGRITHRSDLASVLKDDDFFKMNFKDHNIEIEIWKFWEMDIYHIQQPNQKWIFNLTFDEVLDFFYPIAIEYDE